LHHFQLLFTGEDNEDSPVQHWRGNSVRDFVGDLERQH
jgi:hypothetical protein